MTNICADKASSRRLKVLHLTHHFAPCIGGVERVVEDMCKGLQKEGFACDVACLDRCANSSSRLAAKEKINGTNVYRFPFLDLKYYKIAPSVYRLFRDYDVLHVHGLGFFLDLAVLTKQFHRKPVVLSTHGGITHTERLGALKKLYFGTWARMIVRGADAVCACSIADREMFERISSRVLLMENGVNIEPLLKLNARKEPGTFLYVGRLSANKRIGLLLEAFAGAKEKLGKFRLFIVGEDWEGIMGKLKNRANELGVGKNVEFAGKVSEETLRGHYAKAQFFVSASQHEGFGISAVEAMAAGCVPVLNNIPAFGHFVKGGCGFILDFSNPKEAANGLEGIVSAGDEKLKTIAMSARERSRAYSWKSRIAEFQKLYQKLVQR